MAGWPVRLNQTVNGEKLNTRRQYSWTSSSIMSIQPSGGGSVPRPGVSSRSQLRVERGHLAAEPMRRLGGAHVVGGR